MKDSALLLLGGTLLNIYTLAACVMDLPDLVCCALGFGGIFLTVGAVHTMIFHRN
jgi:hypothetical protein